MTRTRILLTGASGTVGFETFKKLLAENNRYLIRIFVRGSKKNRKLFKPYEDKIETIWGDIQDYEATKKAIENQEIIIHAAAVIPPLAYEKPDYTKKVNYGGTKNLIRAAKKLNEKIKIIYTSSIVIYGDRLKNPFIKINDPPNPNDVYGETKLKSENLIKQSGYEYLIFRLSYIPSVNTLKFDPVMFRMPLNTPIEIIDPRDTAKAILNAINKKEVWNKTYILAGGPKNRIIFKKYLNDLLKIMGFGDNFLPEEAFAKEGFNCGYCETGEIQDLLKFQTHDIKDFYEQVKDWIGIKRYFIPLVKWFIKKYLLHKSKIYKKQYLE